VAPRKRQTQALKAETTPDISIPADGIGHNGPSDEVCTQALTAIQEQWRKKEIAKEEYQAENARYRQSIKDARAKGLNGDSVLDMVRVWQSDPADVTERLQQQIRYSRLMGMPIGTQAEFFEPATHGSPYELGKQKVQGRRRTGSRTMAKNNPYPKGGWQAREFERGWLEGAREQEAR
jgi:hypothetical protein